MRQADGPAGRQADGGRQKGWEGYSQACVSTTLMEAQRQNTGKKINALVSC